MEVRIVDTKAANLASVCAGLRRAGATPVIESDRQRIAAAERLVLPGVGAFGAAMDRLVALELVDLLRERLAADKPTLAICLGLQLLFEESEESPGAKGLGVIPGAIQRFVTAPSIPQIGWNQVTPDPGAELLTEGYAYFANSYRLARVPEGWAGATSHHGERFVAAIERGPLLACQFHPELSGDWGRGLLQRWLARGDASC